MKKCSIIYIYGSDGSGKSAVSNEVVRILRAGGINAVYRWMRFNHYLSKLVNAVGRLVRLSRRVVYADNTTVGYHRYDKSRVVSLAYSVSTILDTFFSSLFKLWIPMLFMRKTIVLDRFIFDTIVDLSIDLNKPDLLTAWQGKCLKMLLPSQAVSIYLETDKDVILKRRPDTKWDENFDERLKLYRKVFEEYGTGFRVSNNGDINTPVQIITAILESNEKEASSVAV